MFLKICTIAVMAPTFSPISLNRIGPSEIMIGSSKLVFLTASTRALDSAAFCVRGLLKFGQGTLTITLEMVLEGYRSSHTSCMRAQL